MQRIFFEDNDGVTLLPANPLADNERPIEGQKYRLDNINTAIEGTYKVTRVEEVLAGEDAEVDGSYLYVYVEPCEPARS